MTPDLRRIIDRVTQALPEVEWAQLQVKWPADDDGLWFFHRSRDRYGEVQIESSSGLCPFLIESAFDNQRRWGETPDEVARIVVELLEGDTASRGIPPR